MTNSKILIKKVTSNKTKQEDGEKKTRNVLSEKAKLLLTKEYVICG